MTTSAHSSQHVKRDRIGVAMFRRYATGVGACLAGVALLAGCGNEGSSGPSPTGEASAASTPSSEATQELATPEQVIVYKLVPVDIYETVEEVPAWPGPAPSEFMKPYPPSEESGPLTNMSGTLTGPEAQVVYEAAVNHPDPDAILREGDDVAETYALWGLEDSVVMLVVEPQW